MNLNKLATTTILLLILILSISAASAASVSIEDANASVGATTTVQIVAYGVTNLNQFGINLSYNPSVVMALSAENNPNLPDDFSGSSLHDFSHASEGYVLLGSNPNTATPESGDVLLTTVTLRAEGGDNCELGLTITTLKDNDSAVITLDSVINGTFTVDTIEPPTLTWQVEPPASVTQGDNVTFRVGFSESADYYFRIVNSTGDVVWRYPTSGTNTAENPTNKTWETTTDTPPGDYTIIININGVDNADNRTVTVEPDGSVETYVSIEDANASVGATTTVQIVAYGVTNLNQFGINLSYNPSVVMALSAENNPNLPDDFSGSSLHDFSHASEGYVLLGSNPSTATPESGDVLLTTVTLQAEGGDNCELGLTITTLKDSDSANITLDYVTNGTFTVEPPESIETRVSIEDATASVGATTTAQIMAYGVTNLSQFGIILSYDPSVVIALSAENNPNLPDDFSGSSLHDFSHASEGYVLLGSNPSTATPESGDVLLTTVTLQAEGGDNCELGLTITTLKDSDSANITLDYVTNGTFTITGATDNGRRGGSSNRDGTYPPEPAPTSAATPAPEEAASPAPTKAPTVAPTKAPTKAPTVVATEIETTEMKTTGIPGFGAVITVFAIAGLLVAAYLVMRRRE